MAISGLELIYPVVIAEANAVRLNLSRPWTLSAEGAPAGFCVRRADEFTATFRWGSAMETTLVRGSPYATARFRGASAVITTQQTPRSVPMCPGEVSNMVHPFSNVGKG